MDESLDAFGHMLSDYVQGTGAFEIVERDDDCADPAMALGHLLATMERLPPPGGETEHGIGTKDTQR
jgi:hypothetical protein